MLVGVVPMGGFGERWSPYPCPKELLPFGQGEDGRPRLIGDYVMERMVTAGVDLIVVPVRAAKASQVMDYFGHKLRGGPPIAYIAAPGPTLVANLQATVPLLRGHTVLFGMPDTYFTPEFAFLSCLSLLDDPAELVLGCWVHDDPTELDTVVREGTSLRAVRPKPRPVNGESNEVWGIAAWAPEFTERLRTWPDRDRQNPGYLFHAAAEQGKARATLFPGHQYVDLGSYASYAWALRTLAPGRQRQACGDA